MHDHLTAWGALPERAPECIRHVGRAGAELVVITDRGRVLHYAPSLIAGRETLAVQAEPHPVWHEATDDERALLGTHPGATAYLLEHGSPIDLWIGTPHPPRPPLTEGEAEALLGSDNPRRWPFAGGSIGAEAEWIEPPTYRTTTVEALADLDEADL